jgi:hypothetical protein
MKAKLFLLALFALGASTFAGDLTSNTGLESGDSVLVCNTVSYDSYRGEASTPYFNGKLLDESMEVPYSGKTSGKVILKKGEFTVSAPSISRVAAARSDEKDVLIVCVTLTQK